MTARKPSKFHRWLAALIAGPDGQVDEAALFVCALGLMTCGTWAVMVFLVLFDVIARGAPFHMGDFAQAGAVLLASAGTTAGIVEGFIGTRDRARKDARPRAEKENSV